HNDVPGPALTGGNGRPQRATDTRNREETRILRALEAGVNPRPGARRGPCPPSRRLTRLPGRRRAGRSGGARGGGVGVAIRIGINGLGRIGRGLLRRSLDDAGLEVTAVNDLAPPAILAHLLRHDSLYGPTAHEVVAEAGALRVDGRRIPWT